MCNGIKKLTGILFLIPLLLIFFSLSLSGCSKKKSNPQTVWTCFKADDYVTDITSQSVVDDYEAEGYSCYSYTPGEEEKSLVGPE